MSTKASAERKSNLLFNLFYQKNAFSIVNSKKCCNLAARLRQMFEKYKIKEKRI